MSIDAQDDILNDFMVESREILEALGQQLVELEQRPDDTDLLNAVFRSFHTIKGGAGFLNLDALVDICHATEDIFNLLRQREKQVSEPLMDQVLRVLDELNRMFTALEQGQQPTPAPAALIAALHALNVPDAGDPPAAVAPPQPAAASSAGAPEGDVSDDEFEALMAALDSDEASPGAAPAQTGAAGAEPEAGAATPPAAASDDEITEQEFDALLDELYGKGAAPTSKAPEPAAAPEPAPKANARAAPAPEPAAEPSQAAEAVARATNARAETTVRVDTAKLDDIMNLVGELVLVRNRLSTLGGDLGEERLGQAVGNLELVTADLQAAVMKTRMQPIRKVFGRFPRLVRDLGRSLDREVDLTTRGEDTDLDKNLVEALADPLVHLVRNAVDHGVESPEERLAAGKPRAGQVALSAEQEGDHILISIADDGRGMDPEALRRHAVTKGVLEEDAARRLTEQECFGLIFQAGFSTKQEISDVSGRGVGMDVVKTRIAQLNGSVEVDSKLGAGSTIRIKVPLTLAILPTLMVRVRERKFALPMSVVREIFELKDARSNVVDGRRTVMVRERALPLFVLGRWVQRLAGMGEEVDGADGTDGRGQVVTVTIGHQSVGFLVDEVIGLEEVVIKPLGAMLHGLPGLAGSTITGDGRIALIVDIPSLLKRYGGSL